MSLIKFIQIGGPMFHGSPALLGSLSRIGIKFSFMYISEKDAEVFSDPFYGTDESVTIVMVREGTIKANAEAYSRIKDKTIILIPSTKELREFSLGIAVGASATLQSGIYIAMQGKVMKWTDYKPTFTY